jgi:hypothetical protein
VGTDPSDEELTEGLDLLNRLILSAFAYTVGVKLRQWPIRTAQRTAPVTRDYPQLPLGQFSLVPRYPYIPPPNSMVIWDGSPAVVYFPDRPEDGAVMGITPGSGVAAQDQGSLVLDGNGLLIDAAPDIAYPDLGSLTPQRWFYRADLGQWLPIQPAAITDECLFPVELDDLWICAVSIRLSSRYGKDIAQGTVARIKDMTTLLRSRYAQTEQNASNGEKMPAGHQSFPTNSFGNGWMV